VKLSKVQQKVLKKMRNGEPFCEFLTFDPRRLAFRTLGQFVPAKLNYVLGGERVKYQTFWVLFKNNFIQPSKYKGSLSPQDGITQFSLTERGRKTKK
jgi:hypothetical protein